MACRVGIEEGFRLAADRLHETSRGDVAADAVRRMTEGIGAVAEDEQRVTIAQAQAGQPSPAGVEPAPAALAGPAATPPSTHRPTPTRLRVSSASRHPCRLTSHVWGGPVCGPGEHVGYVPDRVPLASGCPGRE